MLFVVLIGLGLILAIPGLLATLIGVMIGYCLFYGIASLLGACEF